MSIDVDRKTTNVDLKTTDVDRKTTEVDRDMTDVNRKKEFPFGLPQALQSAIQNKGPKRGFPFKMSKNV